MARLGTAGRIAVIAISIPAGAALILLGVLLVLSPGKPRPFVTDRGRPLPGSVSEKIRVDINGVPQGMFIKGRDVRNPVLLFVHGGTAMPEYFLTRKYPTGLEDYFTVCWWERRGAGLSYSPEMAPETITIEQSISDTLEVAEYLRHRFHKDRIYLMAHCGGSLIAIQAAARAPELFYAYVGVSQMSFQLRSEIISYEYLLKGYREIGDAGMVRQLQKAAPTMSTPLPASYMRIRDKAMHGLGVGTTRDMKSVITGVFLPTWTCTDYTLGEKINLWRGKFSCDRLLWDRMIAMDMNQRVPRLELPVYFFHGRYDYTVAYSETRAYFQRLRAPRKGFYTFENSAHSPLFEEPEKMRQIFQSDILTGGNRLADDL